MNKTLTLGFTALLGAAAGAASAYIFAKKHFEKVLNEELADMRAYFERKQSSEPDTEEENDTDSPVEDEEPTQSDPRTRYSSMFHPSEKPDLMTFSHFTPHLEEEATEEDEALEAENEQESTIVSHPRPPYVISEEEFSYNLSFDKEQITYYELDDTLCDTDESILQPDVIGEEAFSCFDEETNVVFVRNELLGIDYEVERVHLSYSEFVLGLRPETKTKTNKKKKVNPYEDDDEE